MSSKWSQNRGQARVKAVHLHIFPCFQGWHALIGWEKKRRKNWAFGDSTLWLDKKKTAEKESKMVVRCTCTCMQCRWVTPTGYTPRKHHHATPTSCPPRQHPPSTPCRYTTAAVSGVPSSQNCSGLSLFELMGNLLSFSIKMYHPCLNMVYVFI